VTGPLPSVASLDEPEEPEEPVRPARPGTVELAAAMLIVGGVLGVISALASSTTAPAGLEALPLLTLALTLGQVAVGLLIRLGRFWLLAVNYVAVLAFLDLLAACGDRFRSPFSRGQPAVPAIGPGGPRSDRPDRRQVADTFVARSVSASIRRGSIVSGQSPAASSCRFAGTGPVEPRTMRRVSSRRCSGVA
jgi:hypothetical protein